MNKITEQELTELRELNHLIAKSRTEISEHELLKNIAIQNVMMYASKLRDLNETIDSKYGKVDINLETGEYDNTKDISG